MVAYRHSENIWRRGSRWCAVVRRGGRQYWRSFMTEGEAQTWLEVMRSLNPHENPIAAPLATVEASISASEKEIGEALPHLYLARTYLKALYDSAESEGASLWRGAIESKEVA